MNRITPFLWFNADAEEALEFYLSIFKSGKKLSELRVNEAGPGPVGSLLAVDLELEGQRLTFMNGGPGHPPTDAFSLMIRCENQEEIDYYWARLTEGGSEVACGWLKDKFGISWQVTPENFSKLLKSPKAMQAMMAMKKLDIAELQRAGAGVV